MKHESELYAFEIIHFKWTYRIEIVQFLVHAYFTIFIY